MRRLVPWSLALSCCLSSSASVFAAPPEKEDRKRHKAMRIQMEAAPLAPASPSSMGATPGGAQDIGYFRDRVAAGEIPLPQTFTPEGLFSEHDLPLTTPFACKQSFCVEAEAMKASLTAQQDVEYLAQLGFSSGLDPKTFQRAPLNLVAVVDRSGSMDGVPLELVRASLHEVVDQLGPRDQLSIVGYETNAYVMMQPTKVEDRRAINKGIESLVAAGSTAMEEGLRVGFELAEASGKNFSGTTRVMLFTDERPNVGRTDAGSFMSMARAASSKGMGLTTIGVSTHFGAELAQEISSVRGGNLFFFPDAHTMKDKFADEFDTMVTELAYDLNLVLSPAPGLAITGVYGVPGSALVWKDDSIVLDVETIFLSRRKGAIYVGLARDGNADLPAARLAPGDVLGEVALAYEDARDGNTRKDTAAFAIVDRKAAGLGLTRGELLVDQATTLRSAAAAHHERNDQEAAYQLVHALSARLHGSSDKALEPERQLVAKLEATLAEASGHGREDRASGQIDPVTGLPPRP